MKWQVQQEAYWAQWQQQKSNKRWMVELIKKLWNISWGMWDHWNEGLHNSQTTCNEILDSQINKQVQTLHSQGFAGCTLRHFCSLYRFSWRLITATNNLQRTMSGFDGSGYATTKDINMECTSLNNMACIDG